jgi:hypothetical protein
VSAADTHHPLIRRPAPADVEDRAGGERAVVGTEPGDQRRYFLRAAGAAHGDARHHVPDVFRRDLAQDIGLDHRRRDGIDQNAFCCQLFGERFRQADNAGLGGGIGDGVRIAFLSGDGGNIHDPAPARVQHVRHNRPAAVKDTAQVNI